MEIKRVEEVASSAGLMFCDELKATSRLRRIMGMAFLRQKLLTDRRIFFIFLFEPALINNYPSRCLMVLFLNRPF